MKRKQQGIRTVAIYTVFFIVTAYLTYKVFLDLNKTFIWDGDGFMQHFPIMLEFRENIRTIISSGFKEIPFWNWNVGIGMNLISTYTYDLFYWLVVLLPEKLLVAGYAFIIILKLYLAGLFLIFYLNKVKIRGVAAAIGGLTYAFCGYALYAGIRHPFFITPMVIFPLIILGVEYYLKDQDGKLLIFAVLIATISHYYFLYMMAIGTVIYTVARCRWLNREEIKKSIFCIYQIGMKSLIGVMLGAVAIVPNIIFFLSSNRSGMEGKIPFLYSQSYYQKLVINFIGPDTTGNWTVLMFSSIALIALPLLFTSVTKQYRYIRNIFIIMTVMLMIPQVGSIMNGLSNISNRWVFMYAFIVGCGSAIGISKIRELEIKHYVGICIVISIYMLCVLWTRGVVAEYIIPAIFAMIMLFIMLLSRHKSNWVNIGLLIIVSLNISYIGNYYFSEDGKNYVSQFIDNKDVIQRYKANSEILKENIRENEWYRVDQKYFAKNNAYSSKLASNDGFVSNVNTTAQFISGLDEDWWQFLIENGVVGLKHLNCIMGYDDRSILESFLSIKYKVTKTTEPILGVGYSLIAEDNKYRLYENLNVLPLGTFYKNTISEKDYRNLEDTDKTWALLQGAVLQDDVRSRLSQDMNINTVVPEEYTKLMMHKVVDSNGLELKDNKIVVNKENAEIILETSIEADTETYIRFKNLQKKEAAKKDIYVSMGTIEKSIIMHKSSDIYNPKHEQYLINLGYNEAASEKKQIRIRFKNKGTYSFDALEILSVDMSTYTTRIEGLKNDSLKNIRYSTNLVEGEAVVDEAGIMLFSVPYDKGWQARIDGEKGEILKGNIGFIGVAIKEGTHTISLKYQPRGLRLGLVISILTVLGLVINTIYKRRQQELAKEKADE